MILSSPLTTRATIRQHCHRLCAQNPSSSPNTTAPVPATGLTHSGATGGGDGGGGCVGGGEGGGRGGGGGARASTNSQGHPRNHTQNTDTIIIFTALELLG